MKNTKEERFIITSNKIFRISALLVIVFIYYCLAGHSFSPEAALLTVHDHVTNDSYQYTRAGVQYEINGTPISTDYPGLILSNGAAVGPCKAIFEDTLGVSCDYNESKRTFSLRYGTYTIQMTLGNTAVLVNGTTQYMNNAPFVYSFNNKSEKYLYVPTRFVAETFGFVYTWDSTTSTASIICPDVIIDGNQTVQYVGEYPSFSVNGTTVVSENYPGYVFDNTVFFSAEDYFHNTNLAAYAYAEGSGLILLKNGNQNVRMILDSPVAYINDTSYLLPAVPRLIKPKTATNTKVYVPAEFVAKALGYEVAYTTDHHCSLMVSGTTYESENKDSDSNNVTSVQETVTPNTESYIKTLFSEEAHKQLYDHYVDQGYLVPYSISAYSCLNSDAIYLKGVTAENISVIDKNDILEIKLTGYQNPFDAKMYYEPNANFLNYCYIRSESSLRILIIKTNELHYYMYSAPDGCVIHFTNTLGLYQDQLTFTVDSDTSGSTENSTTDIFSSTSMEELLPDVVFSRDHVVIRLPEDIKQQMITDTDLYSDQKFTISIPGNHIRFLSEQDIYDPVKTLEKISFNYKSADNTTVITFKTSKIQGYSITVLNDYLGIRIADPPEIYDKIIVLDAGHGGIDPGTLRGNIYEKNVNFNVTNVYAQEYFKDSDIKVYYTRTTDTKIALQTRADFAASVGADFFISFHVNANSSASASGTSVYYSSTNNKPSVSGLKSSTLAKAIVDSLSAEWNTRNRGVLTEKFVVIHNNTVPAVLVECGYITNNNDFEKIKDPVYQKMAAKALYEAVTEIFDQYPTGR